MRFNRQKTLTFLLFFFLVLLGVMLIFVGDTSLLLNKLLTVSTVELPLLLTLAAWRFPTPAESSTGATNSINTKQDLPKLVLTPGTEARQLKAKEEKDTLKKKFRRRRFLLASSLILFVVLGSLLVYQQFSTYIYPGSMDAHYQSEPMSVAWSPNGNHLAIATRDGDVHLWNVSEGNSSVIYPSQGSTIYCVAWSPDNKYIAFGGDTNKVEFMDATTGNLSAISFHSSASVLAVAWSPKGRYVAFGGKNQLVQIWDFTNQRLVASYDENGIVQALAWSTDGEYLASGGDDRQLHVWDMRENKLSFTSQGYTGSISTLKWSPSSDFLIASAGSDDEVRLWDSRKTGYTENPVKLFRDPTGNVQAIDWSPDGKSIAGGDDDGALHIWDVAQQNIVGNYLFRAMNGSYTLNSGFYFLRTVGWSSNGNEIAIGESYYYDTNYLYTSQIVNFCERWCILHQW